MKQKRARASIEILTSIWEQVLDRPTVDAEGDFFSLGGNPYLASKLFRKIAEVFGKELSPVTIYQARTIMALAALLEHPTPPKFPPIALLKEGTEKPPVFVAHGLGGTILEFFELVGQIRTSHPIYGLQARGTDGVGEPFERIEDMAQYHLEAIKGLQPCGPYLLVGYSLGGLVTLEIAQRLVEQGEKVALLAMLDAYPHKHFLSLEQRMRLFTGRVERFGLKVIQWPIREAHSYISRRSGRGKNLSRNEVESEEHSIRIRPSYVPALQRVQDCAYLALTCYQPCFYRGKIKFVRAEISTEFPDDPAAVWSRLSDKVEVETVPGDHLSMLTVYFESLASVITRYLREAISQECN